MARQAHQCPECWADINLATLGVEGEHEIVPCPDCGSDLEVWCLDPVEVELAPMLAEDAGE
jgi:lysine biosynthesis protein LysW